MIMKKNIILLATVLLLCGCGSNGTVDNSNQTDTVTNEKEENNVDKIEMTELEIKLMSEAYSNEEDIKEGKLREYQVKQVERMRAVDKYLKDKYSDVELELVRCWAAPDDRDGYRFDFVDVKNTESEYTAYVNAEDDTDIKDNYYTAKLTDRYDEWLAQELSNTLGQKVLTYTNFTEFYGDNLSGEESIDEIKKMGDFLSRTTYVFTNDVPSIDEAGKKVYLKVKGDNLYGAYFVYAEADLVEAAADGCAIREQMAAGKSIEKNCSFQTWNDYKEN